MLRQFPHVFYMSIERRLIYMSILSETHLIDVNYVACFYISTELLKYAGKRTEILRI